VSEYSEHLERPTTTENGPSEDHAVELTGHEAVDGVLRSLDTLGGRPVDEHVGVFESAHETLRGALASAGDRPGPAAG
jgi:hypothetical protein